MNDTTNRSPGQDYEWEQELTEGAADFAKNESAIAKAISDEIRKKCGLTYRELPYRIDQLRNLDRGDLQKLYGVIDRLATHTVPALSVDGMGDPVVNDHVQILNILKKSIQKILG